MIGRSSGINLCQIGQSSGDRHMAADERSSRNRVSRRLWRGVLLSFTMVLMAMLALIVALLLGWNSPSPARPPDRRLTGLPRRLQVASGATEVVLPGCSLGDFTAELEALPVAGPDFNGYGLIYRAQDSTRYYAFAVGSDGYYGVLRQDENETVMLVEWQQFPHIRRGRQLNRLRVTCAGPICHLYINDEYATGFEDATWLYGDIGLWVYAPGDAEVTVEFLDVRIWEAR